MNAWLISVYVCSVIGAVFGIFWPAMVTAFKGNPPTRLAVRLQDPATKIVAHVLLGVIIASVVSALGFAAFVGTQQNQQALQAMGLLAYFAAFTSGFSAASLIEEPLKK